MIEVSVINQSPFALPEAKTDQSAGVDLQAVLDQPLRLKPLERNLVKTGIYLALPKGYEAQVRPRSGLALKKGLSVLNSPGTVDADYRGEIGVILVNLSNQTVQIEPGERIAQLVVARHETIQWRLVEDLENTSRGSGGFGSTGKH
jgi:dUTP pyrophosphatase